MSLRDIALNFIEILLIKYVVHNKSQWSSTCNIHNREIFIEKKYMIKKYSLIKYMIHTIYIHSSPSQNYSTWRLKTMQWNHHNSTAFLIIIGCGFSRIYIPLISNLALDTNSKYFCSFSPIDSIVWNYQLQCIAKLFNVTVSPNNFSSLSRS